MKRFDDLHLPAPLRAALRTARQRITADMDVDRLVLFGSMVRGEADAESDADLLIVLTEPPTRQGRDHITSVILDINLEYGTNLSEIIVDQHTWDDGLPSVLPMHREIEEEGVPL